MLSRFGFFKKKIIQFFWFLLSPFSFLLTTFYSSFYFFKKRFLIDVKFILFNNFFVSFIKGAFVDIIVFLKHRATYVWFLITKHRLLYVLRIFFLLVVLYKPGLPELDYVYWFWSSFFYFFSNSVFFFSSFVLPGTFWFFTTYPIKALSFFAVFPAYIAAKRIKKRAWRKFKSYWSDYDLFRTLHWAQLFFVFPIYASFFYLTFFIFSVLIPVVYVYFYNLDIVLTTELIYRSFFLKYVDGSRSLALLLFPIQYLLSFNYFYNIYVFVTYLLFKAFFLTWSFGYILFVIVGSFSFSDTFYLFLSIPAYFSEFLLPELSYFYLRKIVLFFFWFLSSAFSLVCSEGGWLLTFKLFFFSDNFFNFIFLIFSDFFTAFFNFILIFLTKFAYLLTDWLHLLVGDFFYSLFAESFFTLKQFFNFKFYTVMVPILEFLSEKYTKYFSDVNLAGLVTTIYTFVSHKNQSGSAEFTFLNWAFIHLYASILAFWIMDFDFRVSIKTPPRTPQTLLIEAQEKYEWIPWGVDFITLQTTYPNIYFALLDISFEHVESLQFIYGDFEFVDEFWDEDDETPDEEELFNDEEETVEIRNIIKADIDTLNTNYKASRDDPLNFKSSYERHLFSEIVGEPELLYIEEPLRWAFKSIYSPSFEELRFKDTMFSEWVFDHDEDLSIFEVLIILPILFCLAFVFFYNRRRRRYKEYIEYIISWQLFFSTPYLENLLGVSFPYWLKRVVDSLKSIYTFENTNINMRKWQSYRSRNLARIRQLLAYAVEKIRLKSYRAVLADFENGIAISSKFLGPRRRLARVSFGLNSIRTEARDWLRGGDWSKYMLISWKDNKSLRKTKRLAFYEMIVNRFLQFELVYRFRKRVRKELWKSIHRLPGNFDIPFMPKTWSVPLNNPWLYFPKKMRYNLSYYNYVGWKENQVQWRRYAFTPSTTNKKLMKYDVGLQRRAYFPFRRMQRRSRLLRSFQF